MLYLRVHVGEWRGSVHPSSNNTTLKHISDRFRRPNLQDQWTCTTWKIDAEYKYTNAFRFLSTGNLYQPSILFAQGNLAHGCHYIFIDICLKSFNLRTTLFIRSTSLTRLYKLVSINVFSLQKSILLWSYEYLTNLFSPGNISVWYRHVHGHYLDQYLYRY